MDKYDAAARKFAGKDLTKEQIKLLVEFSEELLARRAARMGITVDELIQAEKRK